MTNPVAKNLKRAYRDTPSQDLPKEMADILRKLQEQEQDNILAE